MSVYLQSLEISGFKSFGKRTYLEFSEGITGIVGPNGCGKSNVVESMKWVLGEQSAKSLRGEKMQDIIFAGTKHRSAAGMADVTLTFNNELQWLPLEFPEISIGRRVFRSGEGQYFVNGARSRLKDTTELFLDTGVGKDSYAIFEQGKIDRLLSESAEDRRILFEDFAGISKFKFRKEEAEKKLNQARENLERLQETLDRLEKETAILEEQAEDARNYHAVNNELREMEIKFEFARIDNMKREISRRESEIGKLKESIVPLTERLNEMEEQMQLSDEGLGDKEKLFAQMNEKYIKLEKELTEARTRYQMAEKSHKEASIRMQELEIRSKQDLERIEEWEDTINEKQEAVDLAEKKQAESAKILQSAEQKQHSLKTETEQLEQELLNLSKELGFTKAVNRDNSDHLRKTIAELKGQIFVQESEALRLEEEIKSKSILLEEEEELLKKFETDLKKAEVEKTEITQQKTDLLEDIKNFEAEIQYLEQEQKNLLNTSKQCDQKILTAMDQQINDLKHFQVGQKDREAQLTKILSTLETMVQQQSPLDLNFYQELKNTIQTTTDAYDDLLEKMFGEGGAFSEKIILADQIEHIAKQIETKRLSVNSLRQQVDIISEQESILFQALTEVQSLYRSSEREYQKTLKIINSSKEMQIKSMNQFQTLKQETESHEIQLEKIEKIVLNYDQKHGALRHTNNLIQDELTHARMNHHSAETQTKALKADIKSLEERMNDLQRQIQNSDHDKKTAQTNLKNLEEEMEDLLLDQDELNPELSRLQDQIKNNADEIAELRQAKKVLEQMHKDGLEQFTKLRVRESEISVSLSERKETLETMKNNLQEQFQMNDGDIVLQEQETIEYLNNRIRSYRDKLNQLGNVNLLAIEQFQATKEQYATLLYQKEDIEVAATDTEMLINETNKESSERFVTAFEEIRKSFKKLFSELFDGGRADLILKDRTDPLRSGIDIMAEPPGQKFQNVSLLSGGQRAMVAIAVIFSILELKPTPFVILDEMDAPLDDENIDRFKRLLVRFKGASQFVVVSHSKSTLEVCDVLFGVTMEELGCSKVVSVAFDEKENLLFAQ